MVARGHGLNHSATVTESCSYVVVPIMCHRMKIKYLVQGGGGGGNLRHDHVLITVNIFSIKRK